MLAVVGYAYGVQSLYRIGPYSSVALHTAIVLLLLGLGILAATPDRGPMRLLTSDTAGGILARRLLPALAIAFFAIGWLREAGQHAGLYDNAFGTALMMLASLLLSSWLIGATAITLHRSELSRRQIEMKTREERERFRVTLASIADAVVVADAQG